MKKVIYIWLISFLLGGINYGCTRKASVVEKVAIAPSIYKVDSIVVSIEKRNYDTVPPIIVLTVQNNTEHTIYMGTRYVLEHYLINKWVKVDTGQGFDLAEMIIRPHEPIALDIFLYPEEYHYTPGKYRIRKAVSGKEYILEFTYNNHR